MWYSLYHTDLWGKDHSHGVARLNIGMHQIFSRLPFRNGRIIGSHTRKISINKKKYWGIINWHLKLRQTNTVFLGRGSANLSSGTLKVQQITKLPLRFWTPYWNRIEVMQWVWSLWKYEEIINGKVSINHSKHLKSKTGNIYKCFWIFWIFEKWGVSSLRVWSKPSAVKTRGGGETKWENALYDVILDYGFSL